MKPVERVIGCLQRKKIDRIPKDFSSSDEIIEKLKRHFKIEGDESYGNPLIKCIDARILDGLSCDLRMVAPSYIGPEIKIESDGSWVNLFGIKRRPIKTEYGIYYSYEGTPLKNASSSDVRNYNWPKAEWFDYSSIEFQCEKFKDYAIVAGYPGNVDFLNKAATLVGMEELLIGLAKKKAYILSIFDKLAEFYYEYNTRILEVGKRRIHIAYFGDDYGSQSDLLISPKMYMDVIYSRFKVFYELAKSNGCYIMHHSCGSVGKLIPYLIQAGVDILDVVQPYIPFMDLEELKEKYGGEIAFHGAICVQKLLPSKRTEEVESEVRRVISTLAKGGGYIMSPTNKIGPDVPLENILLIYNTADNFHI